MKTGWDAVSDVDWSRLFHAYGAADDTPDHLRALTGDDPDAQTAALDHLWSAVIHQGTPWLVTPPAAVVVAGLLADPATARLVTSDSGAAEGEAEGVPLRAALLDFLASVAAAGRTGMSDEELASLAFPPGKEREVEKALEELLEDLETGYESEYMDALLYQTVVGIRRVAAELAAATAACLTDDDPRTRVAAAHATATLLALPTSSQQRERFTAELESAARRAGGRDERAGLVLALGELGAAPRDFLTDPDPAVRACAALAPALADDPVAARELWAAVADPAAADDWFTHRPPQFVGHVRFTLLRVARERATGFRELLPAALATARIAHGFSADWDWGPLLAAAFPDPGDPPAPPGRLTEEQRAYLQALVDNEEIWDAKLGNAALAFQRVGLPHDREACRKLVTGG